MQEQGATTKLVPSVLQASPVTALPPEDEMWWMRLGDICAAALLERDKKKGMKVTKSLIVPESPLIAEYQEYFHPGSDWESLKIVFAFM